MADYAISNVSRRVVYAASGTGPYAFTFEILSASDIAVYKGDTLLTLTTDYTVTINPNGTGSVTLVTTAGTSQITIVGSKTIQRTTDFTTGGDFFANTLNDELDAQTIFIQQVAETAERGLKAPVTDPTDINMTLPRKADRALKTLSFDTNGNPIAGIDASDVTNAVNYAANAANSATAAANSASSAASSASTASGAIAQTSASASAAASSASAASTSASNAASSASAAAGSASTATAQASNAATSAANAATSATNASNSASAASTSAANAAASATSATNAQAAAESARDATLAAYDNFDDRYLGAKSSDPATDNDGNALVAGALYFNTVAGAMKLYTGSAWVAAYVSGDGFLALTGGTMTGPITFNNGQTFPGTLTSSAIGTSVQAYDQNLTGFVNTFTLPTTDGSANQVLKTNGSGTLSFGTIDVSGSTVITYENRGNLRSLDGPASLLALVESLGTFVWVAGNTEPDDDESCFATASGRWLLYSAAWDLVNNWQTPDWEYLVNDLSKINNVIYLSGRVAVPRVLFGSVENTITSIGSNSRATIDISVNGSSIGDKVVITPSRDIAMNNAGSINYYGYVYSNDTVRLSVQNSYTSGSANLQNGITWYAAVFKQI